MTPERETSSPLGDSFITNTLDRSIVGEQRRQSVRAKNSACHFEKWFLPQKR
jgi:hypothetical protein